MSIYNSSNNSSRRGSNASINFSSRSGDGILDGVDVITAEGQLGFITGLSNPTAQTVNTFLQIIPLNYPNNTATVSATSFHWNSANLEAQGSDGTQTINIIQDVIFEDLAEPGTLENVVNVKATLKPGFSIPLEYANSTYTIELDLGGKVGPAPNGGRYINMCLLNDFADTVDVNSSKKPYPSGISSMTSSTVLQTLWDQAFHNKTPLKYSDGVEFIPNEGGDALGEPIRVYESKQHHASEEYLDPTTWDNPGYGIFGISGMQEDRRKDVIHLGFNCPEPGVPIKLGTFKLKLNQDIYVSNFSNNINPQSSASSLLEQMNMGQRNRNGLVNGWLPDRMGGYGITQERFLFNSGSTHMSNVSYDEFRPGAPLGLIPTFREPLEGNDLTSGVYSNFGGGNKTGVSVFDDDFDGPYSISNTPRFFANYIKNELLSNAEIITTWGTPSLGSVFVSSNPGAIHGPDLAGQDTITSEDYVYGLLEAGGAAQNTMDNFMDVCRSILWWQYSLYKTLDLYCWAMFPAFCTHNTERLYQTTYVTSGNKRIVNITQNQSNCLSISGGSVKSWAPPGWEALAFNDGNVTDAWADVNDDQTFGETVLSETTSYLHNYVREIQFDVFFTDSEEMIAQVYLDAGAEDANGTPFKGFNPVTGDAGEGITVMQENGPPTIDNYSFGLTTNICWNYFPHSEIINLGGLASTKIIQQMGGRSFARSFKTFTNSSQLAIGARNRKEIREVNLNLGSALGGGEENIIPPGGIPAGQSDATVSVVGDEGALFNVTFKERETVEIDGDNPRAAGSSDPTEAVLNGGFYESIQFGKDNIHKIPKSGSATLLLPHVKPITISNGYKQFELKVVPYNQDPLTSLTTPMPTVIKSKAKKAGDRLIAGNTTLSSLSKTLYQYPNVSINTEVIKHDGSSFVGDYTDTNQLPHFAYEGKALGKPLGLVSDITFLRDNEKNISFEIRIQKSGTFSVNQNFISAAFELNKCSYNNSTTINHQGDRSDIFVGMSVSGEGIPEGATIIELTNRSSFRISAATTGGSKENQIVTVSYTSIGMSSITPTIQDNGEDVEFTNVVAHVGNGLSDTTSNYATLAGRIRYRKFGKRSQTFKIDLTKIFNHA